MIGIVGGIFQQRDKVIYSHKTLEQKVVCSFVCPLYKSQFSSYMIETLHVAFRGHRLCHRIYEADLLGLRDCNLTSGTWGVKKQAIKAMEATELTEVVEAID